MYADPGLFAAVCVLIGLMPIAAVIYMLREAPDA